VPVNPAEVLGVLEQRGALRRGHFRLSSGRHSDVFVQKFRVFEHPRLTQAFGEALAERFDREFDVVASPALGAIVFGFATALAAESRMIFAERMGGDLRFRRGFRIEPHERALVVEDVVTTAASARAVVDLVRGEGGIPVGVGALIDRADPARVELGVRLESLLTLKTESWDAGSCPMCESGQPIEEPGSRRS
jgi:orotate phosphoribosyltransferase